MNNLIIFTYNRNLNGYYKVIYFSIIIPVYNRPETIINTLESIKSQEESSITQVIVIDDCSIDNTLIKINNFKKENPSFNIEIIEIKIRGGPSIARNIGIKKSKGEIIIFLDSDDQLLSGSLKTIYNIFASDNDLSIYFGKIKRLSQNIFESDRYDKVLKGGYKEYLKTYAKQGEVLPVVRYNELISKSNLFNEKFIGNENLLYLKILKNGGTFLRGTKPVRLYDDISRNRLSITNPKLMRNMRNAYIAFIKENGIGLLIYSQSNFFSVLGKIIIYNRLIDDRKFVSFNNFLSILLCPIPKNILKRLKSSYTERNNKK